MIITTSLDNHLVFILEEICSSLQLTETQFAQAEERYNAIGNWLSKSDSPLSPFNPQIYSQGSLKIGTTVKPLGQEEYDLDIVCELKNLDPFSVEPRILLDAFWKRIISNEIYKDKSELKRRCVRINYKNDFHLDILPACPDNISQGTNILIPDKSENNGNGAWKSSNPKGYAYWFEEKSSLPTILKAAEPLPSPETVKEKSPLKLAVQLLKRWRDISFKKYPSEFAPDSIVLTTLATEVYNQEIQVADAFSSIVTRLKDELQNPMGYYVTNPTNNNELLSDKWLNVPNSYKTYQYEMQLLHDRWFEILNRKGIDQIFAGLKELFGEDITQIAINKYAETINSNRQDGSLRIDRNTGMLTSISANSISVKKNTFYGDEI